MSGLRGGIRQRLLADSFRVMVISGLEDRGWFDDGRQHAPLVFATKPNMWDLEVAPNTFSIGPEEWRSSDAGLGNEPLDRVRMYFDFFAEDETVGAHVAGDVFGILTGTLPDLDWAGPELVVFDLRQATPTSITTVDIEDVRVDRAEGFPREWQRHWFIVSCFLSDDYLDDLEEPDAEWLPSLNDVVAQIRAGQT